MVNKENIEKYKKRYKKVIQDSYNINFGRIITDLEIEEGISKLLPRMEEDFKKLPDFSEQNFNRYMEGNNLDLTFSPACIYAEIRQIITQIGVNGFSSLRKYKRAREMEVAARICLALHKNSDAMWMIKAQDSPDIVLVKIGDRSLKEKYILDMLQVEIMSIPEEEKQQWEDNFTKSLVDFIKNKKFTKRYGSCELLIALEFTQPSVPFIDISKEIIKIKDNPYNSIAITAITSEDSTEVTVIRIHPSFSRIDFNLVTEENLWY
jgi:hypothetical protein